MPMLFVYIAVLVAAVFSFIPVWVLGGLQLFVWGQSMVMWFLLLVGVHYLNRSYDSWRMRVTFLYLISFSIGNVYLFRVGEGYDYIAAMLLPWLLMEFGVGVWRILVNLGIIEIVETEEEKDNESD